MLRNAFIQRANSQSKFSLKVHFLQRQVCGEIKHIMCHMFQTVSVPLLQLHRTLIKNEKHSKIVFSCDISTKMMCNFLAKIDKIATVELFSPLLVAFAAKNFFVGAFSQSTVKLQSPNFQVCVLRF